MLCYYCKCYCYLLWTCDECLKRMTIYGMISGLRGIYRDTHDTYGIIMTYMAEHHYITPTYLNNLWSLVFQAASSDQVKHRGWAGRAIWLCWFLSAIFLPCKATPCRQSVTIFQANISIGLVKSNGNCCSALVRTPTGYQKYPTPYSMVLSHKKTDQSFSF